MTKKVVRIIATLALFLNIIGNIGVTLANPTIPMKQGVLSSETMHAPKPILSNFWALTEPLWVLSKFNLFISLLQQILTDIPQTLTIFLAIGVELTNIFHTLTQATANSVLSYRDLLILQIILLIVLPILSTFISIFDHKRGWKRFHVMVAAVAALASIMWVIFSSSNRSINSLWGFWLYPLILLSMLKIDWFSLTHKSVFNPRPG